MRRARRSSCTALSCRWSWPRSAINSSEIIAAIVACPLGKDPWPGVAITGMTNAEHCQGRCAATLCLSDMVRCSAHSCATAISSAAAGAEASEIPQIDSKNGHKSLACERISGSLSSRSTAARSTLSTWVARSNLPGGWAIVKTALAFTVKAPLALLGVSIHSACCSTRKRLSNSAATVLTRNGDCQRQSGCMPAGVSARLPVAFGVNRGSAGLTILARDLRKACANMASEPA